MKPTKHDAPWTLCDNRGVVYVEFLIAFMPLFLLFLGICQLTLLTAARVIVSHAAFTAARSAIVVLEDPADDYDGAPQGSLSEGKSSSLGLMPLLGQLGAKNLASIFDASAVSDAFIASRLAQRGARMTAIRLAAQVPLMTLAPSKNAVTSHDDSIEQGLVTNTAQQMLFALEYTEAAAAVTVHSSESSEALSAEPVDPKGLLSVRVTYLYHCSIPVVRALMCHSLSSLFDASPSNRDSEIIHRLKMSATPSALERWIAGTPRFAVLTGQATLPNQGANYIPEQSSP